MASTLSGVRKQVPELMSVDPATDLPSGSGIGTLPTVATWPASRYSRLIMSRGRALKSSVVKRLPSSSITTFIPPSASSFATGAPPAPVPITHASARIRTSPSMPAPSTTRSVLGRIASLPSL